MIFITTSIQSLSQAAGLWEESVWLSDGLRRREVGAGQREAYHLQLHHEGAQYNNREHAQWEEIAARLNNLVTHCKLKSFETAIKGNN